ncbi:hypothetical protein [Actinomadura sp. K4S16]|uniref:LppU/SCO3897 family protein n=1 Tax=Actinomadura sp. K4S16 TaxID=1316147 RepID=UPI0011EF8AE0|nr:hypothetical protein [Actinomadura sp. K4S16]
MEPQRLRIDLPDPSPGLSRQTKFWLVFTSVFMVAVLVGVPVFLKTATDRAPREGDCLEAEGRGGKTGYTGDFRIVACSAPTAAYRVAMLGGHLGCDDNTYGETVSSGARGGRYLCLMLNAKVGDCFHQEVGFPAGKATKVACGPSATYRITAVVPGRTDPTLCGPDVNPLEGEPAKPMALVYPRPPVTMCTVGV